MNVWTQFIAQYSAQESVQYTVKYRFVGCPDTPKVVTSPPVNTKHALVFPKCSQIGRNGKIGDLKHISIGVWRVKMIKIAKFQLSLLIIILNHN